MTKMLEKMTTMKKSLTKMRMMTRISKNRSSILPIKMRTGKMVTPTTQITRLFSLLLTTKWTDLKPTKSNTDRVLSLRVLTTTNDTRVPTNTEVRTMVQNFHREFHLEISTNIQIKFSKTTSCLIKTSNIKCSSLTLGCSNSKEVVNSCNKEEISTQVVF